MTDDAPAQMLRRALDLTEEMLSAARDAAWQTVAALDGERQTLLRAAFRVPIPHASANRVADLASQVHALNEELVQLSESSRMVFSRALEKLARGRRAQSAYGQK